MVPDNKTEFSFAPRAIEGIRLYNQHRFFEAHEALEDAWRAELSTIRVLYQGILQVGVGFYHLERGNTAGARKVFARAWKLLESWQGRSLPYKLDEFLLRAEELDRLSRDEPEQLDRQQVSDLFVPIQIAELDSSP